METTTNRLCTIILTDQGAVVHYETPLAVTDFPPMDIEAALKKAMLIDIQRLQEVVTRCSWVDDAILILMGSILTISDNYGKVFVTMESVYMLLAKNVIDKECTSWKVIQSYFIEFLYQYGPIN